MFSCVVSILFTPSPCCYQHYLNVGSVVASQGRQNKVRNLKKILPAQAVRVFHGHRRVLALHLLPLLQGDHTALDGYGATL